MKKATHLLIAAAIGVTALSSCGGDSGAKQDVTDLTQYVDSVEKNSTTYTNDNWQAIDAGYNDRVAKVDNPEAKLEAADKTKVEESKAKYASFKVTYEAKLKEKEKPDYRQVLRDRLFGEGKIGADMKFEFVTAANIHDVYKRFVETVDANKDNYTREDWDEIKVLYEALDNRKNAVEKDLASKDNLKIAALKVKFVGIKAVNRPFAKAEENKEAKQ